MTQSCDLSNKKCVPCEGGVPALSQSEAEDLMNQLDGWAFNDDFTAIQKTFTFKGYWKTIAFVNALAWIAQAEGHHPDLAVHYGKVIVTFTTHAAKGLTENDFICAAKLVTLSS